MTQQVNDIRPLSQAARYAGVVFGGVDTIDEAIEQAKNAPDHGLAPQFVPRGTSRNRAAVLQHLNLLRDPPSKYSVEGMIANGQVQAEHDPEPVYGAQEEQTTALPPMYGPRLLALTDAQLAVYQTAREYAGIAESLAKAESYPYPAVQS